MWEGKLHLGLLYLSWVMKTSVHTEAFCQAGIILEVSFKQLSSLRTNYDTCWNFVKYHMC